MVLTTAAPAQETGVTPRHPFAKQEVRSLNTWLRLNVVDQRVYVTDTVHKPFVENWSECRFKPLGLLSDQETLAQVRGRLQDKASLPIRIDVLYTSASRDVAEGLRDAIVKLAYENNCEMQTEVRFDPLTWIGSGTATIFLREGKMTTLYPRSVGRPDGATGRLTTGRIDANDLKQHILWRLLHPGNVPLTYSIEYDEASAKQAKQVADTVKATAKELGLAELVQVTGAVVEPTPETAFLGRWQAITSGEVQAIDIQPRGACVLTTRGGSDPAQAGATVPCPWTPITKGIVIDVKAGAIGKNWFSYRAYLNADGDLVVEKGVVYPQGSFHLSGVPEMVFRKAG
jgi:hypothetical protein